MDERTSVAQVKDDFELLQLMMNDTAAAKAEYRPTQYWKQYELRFLPELQRLGLGDFRRRRGSVLSSFGATDLARHIDIGSSRPFCWRWVKRLPFRNALVASLDALLGPFESRWLWRGISLRDLYESAYFQAASVGKLCGARPLEELSVSLVGNPEDVFVKNGKNYTTAALYYYLRYAYCCRHMSFADDLVIVELGSGGGKQVEVIKKLHPNARFLLFDIPPQLYVCEQFLKAVFPGQVVSYRETREWSRVPALQPGHIYVLPTSSFPLIQSVPVDLFWNAASFQEMEPDVVENFLSFVRVAAKAVFLQELMTGKEVAKRAGERGVREETTLRHYEAGLKGFQRIDLSTCVAPSLLQCAIHGYSDSFWTRQEERLKKCA
jgi:putative sugar O-methyltransferase